MLRVAVEIGLRVVLPIIILNVTPFIHVCNPLEKSLKHDTMRA